MQNGMYKNIFVCCVMFLGISASSCEIKTASKNAVIYHDSTAGPIDFAAQEIREALEENGFSVTLRSIEQISSESQSVRVILTTQESRNVKAKLFDKDKKNFPMLEQQGYTIHLAGKSTYWVIGADEVGAMYGGLDIAEIVYIEKGLDKVGDKIHNPSIARRGIKFNIPLDARTPSYDDTGDAAQNNYAEMWNLAFWKEFLDDMARYRYNTLTLWNPHPFPSIVKLPNYPDAALEDVCVTTLKPTYKAGAWRDPQFVSSEVLKNLKIVKKMSMNEKIEFWRRVMKYAKDRGIDIYFVTWNVLMNSVEGKYGITNAQDNPRTIAYLRQCVRETVLTYPLLAGIGVTAGENMKNRNDEYDREKWLWKTYGLGILDAKKQQPDRKVRFIHRVWNTDLGKIMTDFAANYPDSFEVGFKYVRAHMYSSTKPPFCRSLLKEMEPYEVKCWWNLRNDDIFNFRWGDPEYVRAFLSNLPPKEYTAGYHMGSDGYVWAREFASLEPQAPRALEIRKHWYKFMLWGRLGYDLDLEQEFFEKMLLWRLPETKGYDLYDTWATASKIIPLVNRFHWRNWDFMWAVEGCMDQRKGFHTVRDFINNKTMEESGLMSVPQYVEKHLAGEAMTGQTPIEVAEELRDYAGKSLGQVVRIRRDVKEMSKELRHTLSDIEAMCYLGRYYCWKIRGAAELALFEKTKDTDHKNLAVRHLQKARSDWENYTFVAGKMYRPQLLARTRVLDWEKLLEGVEKDLEIARQSEIGR
jgi:hypothetical protein